MQKFFRYLLLLILLPCSFTLTANPLEGSWQLVSGKLIENDVTTEYNEARMNSIKVIAGNHFSFVSHSGDNFYAAAAGTVIIDGMNYSEIPRYASYPPLIGKTFSFTYELNGDTWEKKRYENSELVEVEVWQRLP